MTVRPVDPESRRRLVYAAVALVLVMGAVLLAAGCDEVIRTGAQDIVVIKLNHDGSTAWTKTIDGGKHYTMYDAIQTSDGGYALGGIGSTPLCNPQCKGYTDQAPTIIRLSNTGEVISELRFPSEMKDKRGYGYPIFRIVQTPDTGFYALSETGTILSVSPSGIARGSRFIDTNLLNVNQINSFYRTRDGGSIISGYTVSCELNHKGEKQCPEPLWDYKVSFIEKLDLEGNTSWSRTYADSGFYEAYQIIEMKDDKGYAGVMKNKLNYSIVLFDKNGMIVNSSVVSLERYQDNLLPGTSGFSVIGSRNANNTYPVFSYDYNGIKTDTKMINFTYETDAIIVPSDSGYVSVSKVARYFTNISVRKITGDGELVWDRQIYSFGSESWKIHIWDVIETSDTGYLVVLGIGKEGNSKY